MQIKGPEFGKPLLNNVLPGSTIKSISEGGEQSHSPDKPSVSLSRFFEARGMPQAPGLIRSLEQSLQEVGIDVASLDRNSAIRALLLHRHGIPLDKTVIESELASLPSITASVAALVENGRDLLASGNLSIAERQQIAALIGNILNIYDYPATGSMLVADYVGAVYQWAFDTETVLIQLVTGKINHQQFQSGVLPDSDRLLFTVLSSPQLIDGVSPEVRDLIVSFRESVSQLQDAIIMHMSEHGHPDQVSPLSEALMAFENSVSGIFSSIDTMVLNDSSQISGILQQFLNRKLESLKVLLGPELIPSDADISESVRGMAGLVKRSGMLFEWHLLAWYRAGKNPAQLRDIYRQDLKGILLTFLQQKKISGKQSSPLAKLHARAAEIMKSIETNQLTNIVNRQMHGREVSIDIPLATRPDNGHARVKITDKSGDESDTNNTRQFVLSFVVETSTLGRVTAFMDVSGKSISVTIELADDTWIPVGADQSDEIRDTLREHGFMVGDVKFVRAMDKDSDTIRSQPPGEDFIA